MIPEDDTEGLRLLWFPIIHWTRRTIVINKGYLIIIIIIIIIISNIIIIIITSGGP